MAQQQVPQKYLHVLQGLKVQTLRGTVTESSRGYWGGLTDNGTIVVTAWTDSRKEGAIAYEIKRPRRNNGGLLASWNAGRLEVGAIVKLIVIEPLDPSIRYGDPGRKVKLAVLKSGRWRITAVSASDKRLVEPA
jgi:hypothetical protein